MDIGARDATEYLDAAGHTEELNSALFQSLRVAAGSTSGALTLDALYDSVVMPHAQQIGVNVVGFCVHSLRATAATNALEYAADIAKVQVLPTFWSESRYSPL